MNWKSLHIIKALCTSVSKNYCQEIETTWTNGLHFILENATFKSILPAFVEITIMLKQDTNDDEPNK